MANTVSAVITIRTRNGVRTKVTRTADGSVVETTCQCFGHPNRVHSNISCPNLLEKI